MHLPDLQGLVGYAPTAHLEGLRLGLLPHLKQPYTLIREDDILAVRSQERRFGDVAVDFLSGKQHHRLRFGGGKGQDIAKACGLNKVSSVYVWDMTAGLGADTFVLASLGATVRAFERNPLVYELLVDGLRRAAQDDETAEIVSRIELVASDALGALRRGSDQPPQVIFLDPMFPSREKKALVKKEMQLFHDIVGADEDSNVLLEPALQLALNRVVVKRPRLAPLLAGREPSHQLIGKSGRFDIYAKARLGD